MYPKKTIPMYMIMALLLIAGLSLSACNDSEQKQAPPSSLNPEKNTAEQENSYPAQSITPENPQPLWKEIAHSAADEAAFQNFGKATQFFINTHSVELNPGNVNWRNAVAAVNITPATREGQSPLPASIKIRYTVDCKNDLILPIDVYLFSEKKAQGTLLEEQALAIGPIKLQKQEASFYNEMKNEVCSVAASDPLVLLKTPKPDWQLIHAPQPPQAKPFFAYIDKNSIHPSIENDKWQRVTMLTQLDDINKAAVPTTQAAEPASQLWQVNVDCTRAQLRFDFVAAMEQTQGQGKTMQVGLSDKGFEKPKEKPEIKLVELVCGANL